ncbi:LOW QUALITY PROTEIN: uncharacterized protein LOC114868721 [Betta splendens]|uniref:LOW QUALITY PROTEIN: uncharacterized protein LOC114868721 n=1 Tax=Betta splendens TaxID=158456 RepID=A0A8M1HLZ8_BETSP|nr:LOW QUALITY PROTEIN: uncharacterized protein LOC114868721 [Betta splendens]
MASRYSRNLSQILWLWLLVLVRTVGLASVSATAIPVSGEIGGNVTFPCPVDKGRTVTFFYVQRKDVFVNGFYANANIRVGTWANTVVDRSDTAVRMYGLNVSHMGPYECYIQYSGDSSPAITDIWLTVTGTIRTLTKHNAGVLVSTSVLCLAARYSKPAVAQVCVEENHGRVCAVTCASRGGYPPAAMRFEVSGKVSSQMWRVVESSGPSPAPDTETHNSSGATSFNCSHGKVENVRCSVGEATSEPFTVCEPQTPLPPTITTLAIIAAAVLLVVAVMGVVCLLLWRRHYTHKNRPSAETAECTANGHAGDVLLNGVTEANAP